MFAEGLGQRDQAGDVVAMLVADEDGVDAIGDFADRGQTPKGISPAESSVYQKARALGSYQGAVAAAAAAEDANAQAHVGTGLSLSYILARQLFAADLDIFEIAHHGQRHRLRPEE